MKRRTFKYSKQHDDYYIGKDEREDATLCMEGLRDYFKVPKRTKRVTLCVGKREHEGSYKYEKDGRGLVMLLRSNGTYEDVHLDYRVSRLFPKKGWVSVEIDG
jgi:hypothetical protein